jgi:hypothetical protein
MAKLTFLIPARNEEFLGKTIEDLLENTGEESEILVGLDGYWPPKPIKDNSRVKIFHVSEPIGQRAMQNQLCRLARTRYVAKVDAHCSFDKDFGNKMLSFFKEQGDDVVAVPVMRNLHAFDWVCECGHSHYQDKGKTCLKCKNEMRKEIKWIGKKRPQSTSYRFDQEPHFQYFNEYKRRPEYDKGGYNETMSLQGSFFMCTRHNYWKYQLCDEKAGSWGNQGIELALSTWLSGLRVLCNHKTWYAHMFRTKRENDFGFPYEIKDKEVKKTKDYIKDKFWNKKHPKQIREISWLIDKFNPPGWEK